MPEPEAAAAAAAPANDGPAAAAAGEVTQPEREGKYPMTPAVRRILKENNLVASQIAPTGKNGRILKEDVIRFLDNGGTTASAPEAGSTGSVSASAAPVYATTPPGQQAAAPAAQAAAGTPVPVVGMDRLATDTIVKVQGLQRTMVKSMNAANAIPQFGYSDECVITNLVALRAQLKDAAAARGVKLSYVSLCGALTQCVCALRLSFPLSPVLPFSLSLSLSLARARALLLPLLLLPAFWMPPCF